MSNANLQFFEKIKKFLFELYPELGKLTFFATLKDNFSPQLNPYLRNVIRYGLPIIILLFVLVSGLFVGSFLTRFQKTPQINPPLINNVTPLPTTSYQSQYIPMRESINGLNLQLPDPVPPVVDYKISLQDINDDYRL